MGVEYLSTKSWCWWYVYLDGKINEVMTQTLAEVKITNNIQNSYGAFQLFFYVDNEMWFKDNIYPNRTINLEIHYADEKGNETYTPILFNLMVLENNIDLSAKVQDNLSKPRDGQKRTSCVTCITCEAFKIMSAIVNRLWESDGKNEDTITPYDAVMKLIDDVGIIDKEIEADGKNDYKLDQLLVPPMSFASALNFLNDFYGIYENQMLKYVQYNGTFTMWDIVKHYNKYPKGEITLHKLPYYSIDDGPKEATILAQKTNDNFVCYDTVQTNSLVNDIITKRGYRQTQIYHPASDIAYYVTKNIGDEHVPHGLISGNDDMKMAESATLMPSGGIPLATERYVVNYDMPGMMKAWRSLDPADNPVITKISDQLAGMHSVRFNIVRQVKIHNLIRVGHVLYLKPYSEHEKDYPHVSYEGAYLIVSSDVTLNRFKNGALGDTVDCRVSIVGFRTNQSYT